jgi:hypothetical protein
MNIDLPNHVYDVDIYRNYEHGLVTPLARGYRFRTEQSAVSRLDNLARIVDSPTGALSLCGFITDSSQNCLIQSLGKPRISGAERPLPGLVSGVFERRFGGCGDWPFNGAPTALPSARRIERGVGQRFPESPVWATTAVLLVLGLVARRRRSV